ncbi:prolipoprotein diacylglyceryl transferase family protein, partial [Klebsiella variicola]|uniref:prolipoprotein diacylglyceryl transferase family protein n=2 Tax=Gammaproteobacteria TaxID=1236 RepID=UPI00195344C8
VWHGGMAFHGGIVGVVVGLFIFARKNKVPFLSLIDVAAVVAPIGIMLGRLANFINGELWGRVTDVPWG